MSDLSAEIIKIHREQWERDHLPDALLKEPEPVRREYMESAYMRDLKDSTLESLRRGLSG